MINKLKKILFTILAVILPTAFNIHGAFASENDSSISYQRIDGAYFYLVNNSTGAIDTNYVTKFYLNGAIAYCIEPMQDINTRVYSSTNDWNVTSLSEEQRKNIEMIGYFGYEYAGHGNDRFWLAAQELIWNTVNPNVSVRFTTGANGTGDNIDLTGEKNEILSLINNYQTRPSFDSQLIEGYIGDELTLTDSNNVLSSYEMSYNGNQEITKEGNTLNIKLKDNYIGTDNIHFYKNNYDNEPTIIYYQGESQKLARLRISNPITSDVTIKSKGGDVEVDKTGEKLVYEDASYHYEDIKLSNTTFAVYSNEDILDFNGDKVFNKYELVGTLTSNSDGYDSLHNLYYGKYFVIEGETDPRHVLDNQKYDFEIIKGDLVNGKLVKRLEFKNFFKKGTLEFTKTDLVTGEVIPNTTVMIFTEDDRLIFTGTTDENGKITITDLPVGEKFYMIEKNPSTGYQITDEIIYFEITENGEVVKANMTNKKIEESKETPEVQVVEVPNTGLNTSNILNIVAIVFTVAGVCYIVYDKKKRG